MPQASQLSPELARGVLQLARSLAAALRNWTIYPPEHPTIGQSIARLREAIQQASLGSVFSLGIAPTTLLVEGLPAGSEAAIAEAAAMLHDRDLLQITFVGEITTDTLRAFLRVLAVDPEERRRRGGPAAMWQAEGDGSLALQQIDYEALLARDEASTPEPAKRDDLWRSIVVAISGGQTAAFDERAQQRLLAIAGSALDIKDLASAVMAPKCATDGSPMITSQAAVVLAAFRHLSSIVAVMAPDRTAEVMSNLAAASAQLHPHVVMQVLNAEEDPDEQLHVVRHIAAAFDDTKVAQLLATALALDGQASDRLATIFNTIAPDTERKRRVLTLTRHLLSESDFGRSDKFQALWQSAEELLVAYNDRPFVSAAYRAALDGVGGRAERMAATELPAEAAAWIETLNQESVRRMSVTLLIDLLTLEGDPARAEEIAYDLEALAEDLLMSGAYADTLAVVRALSNRATKPGAIGRDAARQALDRIGDSLAMRETALLAGDVDEETWTTIRSIAEVVGPSAIEAVKPLVVAEQDTVGSVRAADTIVYFGPVAVGRLASLVGDGRWYAQRAGARLLGRIATAEAVPLLQPLVRKSDPRVAQEAIRALTAIDDPAAARAVHTVLRAATGELRRAVIDALVADRDARVVPMLVRIIEESQPLGRDHAVVLESVDAIGVVGHDSGVPVLVATIRRRSLFGRKKLKALKQHGVGALRRIGGERADAALRAASQTGDRMLRTIVAGA